VANWPTTLPQSPISDGFSSVPQNNLIRSSKEAGPVKSRPRFTAVSDDVTLVVVVDSVQVQTLQNFYDSECAFGSLPFNWRNFKLPTKPPCAYRFKQPPEFQPMGGGWWRVPMNLERLP
jgi:hypothetical protein